jgi:hypothetical protein
VLDGRPGVVQRERQSAARPDRRGDAGARFNRCAQQGGLAGRKPMIDRSYKLPLGRPAKLLGLSRRTGHCEPRPVPAAEFGLCLGSTISFWTIRRQPVLRDLLPGEGEWLFATLMRQMRIEAPYLLRVLAIAWPRAMDRTSRWRGFVNQEAAVDWISRRFWRGCRSQRSSQFTSTASTGLLPGKRDRPLTAVVPGGTTFSHKHLF